MSTKKTTSSTARKGTARTTTKSRPTITERAESIIKDCRRYDIDTRLAVSTTLKSLKFYESGRGQEFFPPEQIREEVARCEKALHASVTLAESGEAIKDEDVEETYTAAARGVIFLLDSDAVPDFFTAAITTLLDLMEADTGVKLWGEISAGEPETGGYSTHRLARFFKSRQKHELRIERKKDLPELIAAVLNHDDVPAAIHNAIGDAIGGLPGYDPAHRDPGMIRAVLSYQPQGDEQDA